MPFSTLEDQHEFNRLMHLITQSKSTEFTYSSLPQNRRLAWLQGPRNSDERRAALCVGRKINQPFNEFGPDLFYYIWKNPDVPSKILKPAFSELGPVGLTLTIPRETSPEDLQTLFYAIAMNRGFAEQIVEMDFEGCLNLRGSMQFPPNLVRLQNLNMERMSPTSVVENYDDLGPMVVFNTAAIDAPDFSALRDLKTLRLSNTRLADWPTLPNSLEEYVQYGSGLNLYDLNLSMHALPNLRFAYFDGVKRPTEAYAICLSLMLRERQNLNIICADFDLPRMIRDAAEALPGQLVREIPRQLTKNILDAHFNQIIEDSAQGHRELVGEHDLIRCARILDDMLAHVTDTTSRSVLSMYVRHVLPEVTARLSAVAVERAEMQMRRDQAINRRQVQI